MKEVFKNIIKKLEELKNRNPFIQGKTDKCRDASVSRQTIDYAIEIVKQAAEEYNNGWIPFTKREMTEDEKESFGDLNFMLDCKLPEEDEEILVTYKFNGKFYVDNDIFLKDGSECYLDSSRDLVTEAVAWRKKPEPYQPKGE